MSSPASQRLVQPQHLDFEGEERSLRPLSLDQFLGQEAVKQNLKIFVSAAKQRERAMDHVLFFGPPGLGKTTLAQVVAKELGVGFRATSGPVIAKAGDLAALLTNLQPQDVLFIDEIHRLPITVEEILYPAMEDFKLDLMIGEGPAARSVRIDLPPFTLIGATTRSGLLSSPLRDRFGIPLNLIFYTPNELDIILRRAAPLLEIPLGKSGSLEIAKRARGTPRIALRLLRRVGDFALVKQAREIDAEIADAALGQLEVDQRGLDALDRKYLTYLVEHFQGGPVGVETLAAALAEPRDTLEEVIEPYLIQQGLLQRTPRGRVLSASAYEHLGLPSLERKNLFDLQA